MGIARSYSAGTAGVAATERMDRPRPGAGPKPDQAGGFQMMTFSIGSPPGASAMVP